VTVEQIGEGNEGKRVIMNAKNEDGQLGYYSILMKNWLKGKYEWQWDAVDQLKDEKKKKWRMKMNFWGRRLF